MITNSDRDHVTSSKDFIEAVLKCRVVRHTSDLDEATLRAIASAEVDPKYAFLDDLLTD